jgi:hypothetical protein
MARSVVRDAHESKTDKDAFLFKKHKGAAAKLSCMDHLLMENRHGLVADTQVTQVVGTAEREAAFDMDGMLSSTHRVTLGGDKNYETQRSARTTCVAPTWRHRSHRSGYFQLIESESSTSLAKIPRDFVWLT